MGLCSKEKNCNMLCILWYPPPTIISSAFSDERASRAIQRAYSARDEGKDVT
jgi:hypothetical protein